MRSGRHAGDWEMVAGPPRRDRPPAAGRLRAALRRRALRVADRAAARRAARSSTPRTARTPPYLRPGVRDRTFPDPNDEADGTRRRSSARGSSAIDARAAALDALAGHAGAARGARWWNPAEQDSPFGPAFQGQGRWSDPDALGARARARSCRADCDDARRSATGARAPSAAARCSHAALARSGCARRRRLVGVRAWRAARLRCAVRARSRRARSRSGASGTSTRLAYSAPPRSASARSGSHDSPYCLRSRAGSSPTVMKFTSSSTGRRASGTGGRMTMSIASSRAADVTNRSSPSSMPRM